MAGSGQERETSELGNVRQKQGCRFGTKRLIGRTFSSLGDHLFTLALAGPPLSTEEGETHSPKSQSVSQMMMAKSGSEREHEEVEHYGKESCGTYCRWNDDPLPGLRAAFVVSVINFLMSDWPSHQDRVAICKRCHDPTPGSWRLSRVPIEQRMNDNKNRQATALTHDFRCHSKRAPFSHWFPLAKKTMQEELCYRVNSLKAFWLLTSFSF